MLHFLHREHSDILRSRNLRRSIPGSSSPYHYPFVPPTVSLLPTLRSKSYLLKLRPCPGGLFPPRQSLRPSSSRASDHLELRRHVFALFSTRARDQRFVSNRARNETHRTAGVVALKGPPDDLLTIRDMPFYMNRRSLSYLTPGRKSGKEGLLKSCKLCELARCDPGSDLWNRSSSSAAFESAFRSSTSVILRCRACSLRAIMTPICGPKPTM